MVCAGRRRPWWCRPATPLGARMRVISDLHKPACVEEMAHMVGAWGTAVGSADVIGR